jgi:hypothetical protein
MTAEPDLGPPAGLVAQLATSSWGRWLLGLLRWAVPLLLLAIIGPRLTQLGWRDIWIARPSNLGFYVLLVVQFFIQPWGDYLVYRNLWGAAFTPPMAVILRKRLLNTFMLDYSGEAFFYFWCLRHLKLTTSMLVHSIKDSNVLSGGAGLIMLYMMGLLLLATGGLTWSSSLGGHGLLYGLAASVPLVLCALLIFGRRKFTALSRGQIAVTFLIHLGRAALVLTVEFGLWELSGALPSAVACLQFVALRLVVTRLPLVPNKDLIFVGAGIAAAGLTKVSVTPVATILVVLAAADLVLAAGVASFAWLLQPGGKEK